MFQQSGAVFVPIFFLSDGLLLRWFFHQTILFLCVHFSGHGEIEYMSKEASMKCKRQNKILTEFATQQVNTLVATSVAEEGLDIRKCNLVVRFDLMTVGQHCTVPE